jgi:hypothetical protein
MGMSKEVTGRTAYDFVIWTVRALSLKQVVPVLLAALGLLPILYLYRLALPELFTSRFEASASHGSTTSLMVPASQLWVKSGMNVALNDIVRLRVSGAVNMAAHRLQWSSLMDTPPEPPWVFYPGQPLHNTGVDSDRDEGTLSKDPIGTLLMYVATSTEPEPSESNPRPKAGELMRIATQGSSTEWVQTPPMNKAGQLYFVVNDVVADRRDLYIPSRSGLEKKAKIYASMREALISNTRFRIEKGESKELGEYFGHHLGVAADPNALERFYADEWERLQEQGGANRLWYDDNTGAYLVTIEVSR